MLGADDLVEGAKADHQTRMYEHYTVQVQQPGAD